MQRDSSRYAWGAIYVFLIFLILLIASLVWTSVENILKSDFNENNRSAVAVEIQQVESDIDQTIAVIFTELFHHSETIELESSKRTATAPAILHLDPWALDV